MRPKGGKVKRKQVHSPCAAGLNQLKQCSRSFFATAAMLWSISAYAQQYFHLRQEYRMDQATSRLQGATLEVKELKRFAVTDEFGNFQIRKITSR